MKTKGSELAGMGGLSAAKIAAMGEGEARDTSLPPSASHLFRHPGFFGTVRADPQQSAVRFA